MELLKRQGGSRQECEGPCSLSWRLLQGQQMSVCGLPEIVPTLLCPYMEDILMSVLIQSRCKGASATPTPVRVDAVGSRSPLMVKAKVPEAPQVWHKCSGNFLQECDMRHDGRQMWGGSHMSTHSQT